MKNYDLVSIIVPVYNIEKYLKKCLESLLNQTYENIEIIAVNDGSTDQSLKVLQEYAKRDYRLKTLNQENKGVSEARNEGIKKAEGNYIMFVDGDDYLEKETIQNMVRICKQEDADIVRCTYVEEMKKRQIIKKFTFEGKKLIVDPTDIKEQIYTRFITGYELNSIWGQLIKADIIKQNEIYLDTQYKYAEDMQFCYQLYTYCNKIVLLNEPYYHYIYSPTGATKNRTLEKITNNCNNAIDAYSRLYDYLKIWKMGDQKNSKLVSERVIKEFLLRTKDFFALTKTLSKKKMTEEISQIYESKKVQKSLKQTEKINVNRYEYKKYAQYILKGQIEKYVVLGRNIFKGKEIIKRIINLIQSLKSKTEKQFIKLYLKYKRVKNRKLFKQFKRIQILNDYETINEIINSKKSVARFGDGELNMIIRPDCSIGFQNFSQELSTRMKEILADNSKDVIYGMPLKFKSLKNEIYESEKFWTNYITEFGEKILLLLDKENVYINTNFTRFYMDYKNKSEVPLKIEKIKQIWNNRDVIMIEGKNTKLGVGNDLFQNAKTIERIICPSKDAFQQYEKILEKAQKIDKQKLILIALGPTATVLAYDLGKIGYQAIDVGHIDVEYEWYTKKAKNKIAITGKAVNEAQNNNEQEAESDELYYQSILEVIE